ncbi:MAG: bifunctional 5,10-methylenetetrahydrofolate dehydrogenase/5,10-methenyltetrahydrofolate cyclohydrolase [Candidatus Omnitrophota bacterium]
MKAKLLSGSEIAAKIKENLKTQVEELKKKYGYAPALSCVQVGENAASGVYVKSQAKTAESLGIGFSLQSLPAEIKENDLIDFIKKLNADAKTTAVILQMPMPKQIDAKKLIHELDPRKDAEGLHPENMGKIVFGDFNIAPCTPMACMELLGCIGERLYGKEAVIVGHSEIVGKPLALMLLSKFATTTVCHIATGERGILPEHVNRAEVLIVAVGKAGIIKGEWIKEGAIVIDVGINRVGDKILGDVEFEKAAERAAYITPVPGGVGPLTVTMLMRNVVEAFKLQRG